MQKEPCQTFITFIRICITRAILKLLAGLKSGVYFVVNEHFQNKADAKRALLDRFLLFAVLQHI